MSAPSFTPGPWLLEARSDAVPVYAVFGRKDEHITKVDGTENARLIAAAPCLYQALSDLTSTAQALIDRSEDSCDGDIANLEAAMEALKLAGMTVETEPD